MTCITLHSSQIQTIAGTALKIRKIGNSLRLILPQSVAERLNVRERDERYRVSREIGSCGTSACTRRGCWSMRPQVYFIFMTVFGLLLRKGMQVGFGGALYRPLRRDTPPDRNHMP